MLIEPHVTTPVEKRNSSPFHMQIEMTRGSMGRLPNSKSELESLPV